MDNYIDISVDKICEHMYCTECGNKTIYLPRWTGQENYYIGICNTCKNDNAEFVYDNETPEEKAGV